MSAPVNDGLVEVDAGPVALHARNVRFDLTESPLQWIPGEPVASHTLSALHLLLPIGEKFFVDTFSRALPHIRDEKLREDVIGFIGQEQIHSDTHDKALREYLSDHGVDMASYIRSSEELFERYQRRMDSLPENVQYRLTVQGVGAIAGLEHLTSTGGDWLLNQDFEKYGADQAITDMLRWHGAEEVEHRSVAFDLARHLGVTRPMLVAYYIAGCTGIVGGLLGGAIVIARGDATIPNVKWHEAIPMANRAMKSGSLFSWSILSSAFKAYLKPGFHPNQIGSTAQAVAYLAKSPAAKQAAHG